VGPHVTIGPGCRLLSHVVLTGHTTIGPGNVFHPFCLVGGHPQDRKYKGEPTRVEIGANNSIRESVTVHVGTERGGGVTRIGANNLIMINTHVAHDVQIANNCTIANNSMLGGHVIIDDNVNIMGGVGIHQYVTVGKFSFLGGYARIHFDAPPFCRIDGADEIRGLNAKGLIAGGFPELDIQALDEAYRRIFDRKRGQPFADALAAFDTMNGLNPHVKHMIEFLRRRDTGKQGRYLQAMLAAKRNR
jgi:UDP-N-acetylglucosamine acyltransferase